MSLFLPLFNDIPPCGKYVCFSMFNICNIQMQKMLDMILLHKIYHVYIIIYVSTTNICTGIYDSLWWYKIVNIK